MRSAISAYCFSGVATLLVFLTSVGVRCQPSVPAPGIDAVRAMLIGTSSWTVEYLGDASFLGGAYVDNTRETLTFTSQGSSLKVAVTYRYRGTCEADVELLPDGFKYRGCLFGEMNDFRFHPKKKDYPFTAGDGPWAKHLRPTTHSDPQATSIRR